MFQKSRYVSLVIFSHRSWAIDKALKNKATLYSCRFKCTCEFKHCNKYTQNYFAKAFYLYFDGTMIFFFNYSTQVLQLYLRSYGKKREIKANTENQVIPSRLSMPIFTIGFPFHSPCARRVSTYTKVCRKPPRRNLRTKSPAEIHLYPNNLFVYEESGACCQQDTTNNRASLSPCIRPWRGYTSRAAWSFTYVARRTCAPACCTHQDTRCAYNVAVYAVHVRGTAAF